MTEFYGDGIPIWCCSGCPGDCTLGFMLDAEPKCCPVTGKSDRCRWRLIFDGEEYIIAGKKKAEDGVTEVFVKKVKE